MRVTLTILTIITWVQISFAFDSLHITLQPNEKREPIEIEESCLVLRRDYKTVLHLSFGKSFEWTLPVGTKIEIPKGKFELENKSSSSVLEFDLLPIQKCSE